MTTPIVASPEHPPKTTAADVLRAAADDLASTYTAARITSPFVVGAIRRAAAVFQPCWSGLATSAGDALEAHMRRDSYEAWQWLCSYSQPRATAQVLVEMRAAADSAEVRANAERLDREHAEMDQARADLGRVLAQPSGNSCQVGSCHARATAVIQACGAVYVCDACRAQITGLASMYADGAEASA